MTAGDELSDVDLAATLPTLGDDEVAALREVGQRWDRAVAGPRTWRRALPVDPALHRFPSSVRPAGAGRFAAVDFVASDDAHGVTATPEAGALPSPAGEVESSTRRLLVGRPLASTAVARERMRKLVALPVLSSDALSSVAYGPEAMLAVLALAGTTALDLSFAISAVIVALMIAVGLSYRQVIRAYPHGGGSYVVAGHNLGEAPSLVAAGGLLLDYVLTVAVSISAGVAAITSALPELDSATVPIGLGVIALLLIANLRGVREAGSFLAAPTYAFVFAMFLLIVVGLADAAGRGFERAPVGDLPATEGITALLVLRAFSSGATAMTGIEAISNAVPAFQPPAWVNARRVLTVMLALLVSMFVGLVILAHVDGVVPTSSETVLSQLAHESFGSGPLYAYIQITTALILLLAANTAFSGFPRLLSFMARNGHAPRQFLRLGDRLAFSNGIIFLAAAAAIIYAAFEGDTSALIPLYAIGVFVAFTLAQAGMVVHWSKGRGDHWRKSVAFNALGAALSAVVFVIAAATKFTEGAWVALLIMALLVALAWRISRHYRSAREALAVEPPALDATGAHIVPRPQAAASADGDAAAEHEETPEELRHLVVVPVARLDLANLRALAYAASLGEPLLAVHISPTDDEEKRFREYWHTWGDHLPLEIVSSPYRALVAPLARYLEALHSQKPDLTLTVVFPEIVAKQRWHQLLHNGTERRLRRVLRNEPGVVTTTVPFHLPS